MTGPDAVPLSARHEVEPSENRAEPCLTGGSALELRLDQRDRKLAPVAKPDEPEKTPADRGLAL
jgi:hypothetical protein